MVLDNQSFEKVPIHIGTRKTELLLLKNKIIATKISKYTDIPIISYYKYKDYIKKNITHSVITSDCQIVIKVNMGEINPMLVSVSFSGSRRECRKLLKYFTFSYDFNFSTYIR